MSLTCGFTGGAPEPHSVLAGQSMITCVRGGLEPLAYILGVSTEPWLSV
jgi:hypothetical protein